MQKHFSYNNKNQLTDYLQTLQKNLISRRIFQNYVLFELKDKKVLELGVRDGFDISEYLEYTNNFFGVEPDIDLFKIAKKINKKITIKNNELHDTGFKSEEFDLVISKYTIPQSKNLQDIITETARVLKKNGQFIFLVNHPFRQFYEKKDWQKNYFNREIINPKLFDGLITLNEYSYTFNDYLSKNFLEKFKIDYFLEKEDFNDLSSEQINGDNYPCFFIIKATKR
jgi:SAM-dependent methyltransferase